MNILDSVRAIEFDKNRNHIFGIKSAILWGHSKNTNSIFPLLYISKPKHISKEDFELLLDKMEITLSRSL